ncbi:siderophore ABC transporter substrate-binding protein [Flaviflagellibacter deserti]|uniref:Siderophore ABC transporter substrate-binding protein n=1 Tax=Flaviflagellibacter deserti TaxID=2267266 RepID=A0ABV9Z0N0_9HYPH
MKAGFGLILCVVAVATSAGTANAIEITTATGKVEISGTPKTIAVFDIAALDTLDRLGVAPAGIPDNLYVPELKPIAPRAEVVGTLFEPNLEALSALSPDLVIIGGRSSTQGKATSRIAQTIDMSIGNADLVGDAMARLDAYGALFGKQEEAAAARKEFEAALERARAAVASRGTALIVMTNGPKVTAYGMGSRFGWLHSALGLPPAVKDVEATTHGEAISFEFIREANPDWLIVVDRAAAIGSDDQNARATLDNELVAATTAWKTGQVIYMPAADFYIAAGGVQAMSRILATITKAFSGTK